MNKDLSLEIVIPVYNEESVLPLLYAELEEVFTPETCAEIGISTVKCLFVDDGSTDSTVTSLLMYRPENFSIEVIRLSRNFGHQPAVSAGLSQTKADLVAVMDSDLQDPPELIPTMISKIREGNNDVVYAQRNARQENPAKMLGYSLFYKLYSAMSPIDVAAKSGDFSVMSRRVVDEINRLPESLRFVRGLRSWVGFKQEAIGFDRPSRAAGEAKYTMGALYKLATDGLASLSIMPLKLAQLAAIIFFVLSIGMACFIPILLGNASAETFWIFVVLTIIVLGMSLNMAFLYIIGAYLGRSYLEIKGRPAFIISEILKQKE